MHYFGDLLQNYGADISYKSLLRGQGYREGRLVEGIDFSANNDNQFVPLLRIRNNRLVVINKPK